MTKVFECQISTVCDGKFPCSHQIIINDESKIATVGEIYDLIKVNTNQGNYPGIALESVFLFPSDISIAELEPLKEQILNMYIENNVDSKQCSIYWEEEKADSKYPGVCDIFESYEDECTQTINSGFHHNSIKELLDDTFDYFARHEHCLQMCIIPFANSQNTNLSAREALSITLMKRINSLDNKNESNNDKRVPTCWLDYSLKHNSIDPENSSICTLCIEYQ